MISKIQKTSIEMSKTLNQIRDYALSRGLPLIPIQAKDVFIIGEPNSFFKSLLELSSSSKERICLSALYIGAGKKERALIQEICENIKRNPSLQVDVVLDKNRATRYDEKGQSSLTTLDKLIGFPNARINLVDTIRRDSFVNRFLQRFQKWNELSSTYHSKLFVLDDNVILSGANLSSAYFENRQDRYILIKESKLLSNYATKLLEKSSYRNGDLRDEIIKFNSFYMKELAENDDSTKSDTYIIPLVQNSACGLKDKENFLDFINFILPQETCIYLSSGYFNPSSCVENLKLTSVLAPSERANGFYNGKGLLKYIPFLYTLIQENYAKRNSTCSLKLYDRQDWSFHAKGIWIEGIDGLYIHLLGSSNFNHRSFDRDFEAEFVVVTRNEMLMDKLRNERKNLWSDSSKLEIKDTVLQNLAHMTCGRMFRSFL